MNDVSGEILADAGRLISSDRAEQHGDMRANHENIANLWAAYLGTPVSTHDIALMMSLLKIARTKTGNPGYNNLPPIVVPFPMRALEPWTTGEAERFAKSHDPIRAARSRHTGRRSDPATEIC